MSQVLKQIEKFASSFREEGWAGVRHTFTEKRYNLRQARRYRKWLRTKGRLTAVDVERLRSEADQLRNPPLISIILPVYNVDKEWLRRCLDSVTRQIYPHWELCIADDASTASHVPPLLNEYADGDDRIKVVFRKENGHISAASNSALALATGGFAVLLDHDDELSQDALFWVAKELNAFPETAMIYSDEDLIDESGRRHDPKFKPDFSRDLFYSTNLVTHLSGYRTELLRKINGFRVGFEGSQDYDLALRVLEQISEDQIRHIPRVLYHWRVIKGSVAFGMDEKPYAHQRARDAIREHLERTGFAADVQEAPRRLHRVRYRMPQPPPRVSVIISAENETHSPGGFEDNSYQIIIADQRNARRAERLNKAADDAAGDVLVFLDNELFAENADAINELVRFSIQQRVGAVSGKILRSDMYVEQTGIVLRHDLSPAAAHDGLPRASAGNISRNILTGNSLAVSLSCMAISRRVFQSVDGFDASMPDPLIDIDLCLRLREENMRILVVPNAEFVRQGPRRANNISDAELVQFSSRWSKYIEGDPFCNTNLKRDGSFEIEL